MDARSRLIAHLQQAGLSTARAEANVDAYAHQLAEQQRAHANAMDGEPGCWHDGAQVVADLIDPEKQR